MALSHSTILSLCYCRFFEPCSVRDLESLILVQISLDFQVERGGPVKADAVGPLGHD